MRILFFIMGVGAGNTTRNLAILEELKRQAPDADVQIAAQGKALDLLRQYYPVHPLREVTYAGGGEFSLWNILKSNMAFPVRFFQNRTAARLLMMRLKPDLVVADSDFYCLGPARNLGLPIASINNSAVIVADMKKDGLPKDCGFSARLIEQTDFLLQERYATRVICPVLRKVDGLDEKYVQIPPIVRPEFTPGGKPGESVVVVTGGSGIGAQEMDLREIKASLVTYGTILRNVPPHAQQLGFTLDVSEAMKHALVLVVQGGFSSVSEAMALQRPTVVVPIAHHAEQHVNARILQSLGIGLSTAGAKAAECVNRILADQPKYEQSAGKTHFETNGAEIAARELLKTAADKPNLR